MKDDAKALFLLLAEGNAVAAHAKATQEMHPKRVKFLQEKWLKAGLVDKRGHVTTFGQQVAEELRNPVQVPTVEERV